MVKTPVLYVQMKLLQLKVMQAGKFSEVSERARKISLIDSGNKGCERQRLGKYLLQYIKRSRKANY